MVRPGTRRWGRFGERWSDAVVYCTLFGRVLHIRRDCAGSSGWDDEKLPRRRSLENKRVTERIWCNLELATYGWVVVSWCKDTDFFWDFQIFYLRRLTKRDKNGRRLTMAIFFVVSLRHDLWHIGVLGRTRFERAHGKRGKHRKWRVGRGSDEGLTDFSDEHR